MSAYYRIIIYRNRIYADRNSIAGKTMLEVKKEYRKEDGIRRISGYTSVRAEDKRGPLVFIVKNKRIHGFNHAVQLMLGYSSEELTGMAVDDLFSSSGPFLSFPLKRGSSAGKVNDTNAPVFVRAKNGRRHGVYAELTVLNTAGETMELLECREYGKLNSLSDTESVNPGNALLKAGFYSLASHELRTPLNGVIGMSSLLLASGLDSVQAEYAGIIRSSGEALMKVINNLIDYSRLETGDLRLRQEFFSLRESVNEVIDLISGSAREKRLNFRAAVDDDVPDILWGDRTRLLQVLNHLTGNAVKFTGSGSAGLQVSSGVNNQGRTEIIFSVYDTGIGISPEIFPVLFEPFVQADSSSTRKFEGLGLGLAISSRLAKLMEGGIKVQSEPGRGSVFTFTARLGVANAHFSDRAGKCAGALLKDKEVLVVEDDLRKAGALIECFRSWGMVPVVAGSAAEVKAQLNERPLVRLVVTTHPMPGLKEIFKEQNGKQGRKHPELPIILLSSSVESLQNSGADTPGCFGRLVHPGELFDAVVQEITGTEKSRNMTEKHSTVIDTHLSERIPIRILVAEDNLVNQKFALSLLNLMGYKVDAVINGVEVLQALEKKEYDIILMDLQMPEMNGIEATVKIREIYPPQRQPYIIAITANAMLGDRETCLEAGMVDYMSKPIRIDELQELLERWGKLKLEETAGKS